MIDTLPELPTDAPRRRPRLALMGEFSAGKSTLTNLLLGGTPLPVRVTATRLPPVWISQGRAGAWREDLDGGLSEIDAADLESVPLEQTRTIRLSMQADILDLCDLIDMPGISDPNMDAEIWERVIGEADHIVWCSHATQAWRQSEAAVWDAVPDDLRARSLLLLTRFDKIVSPADRDRVLSRVRRETAGLFADLFPVSLLRAMQAGDDRAIWDQSGAEPFLRRLVALLSRTQTQAAGGATGETDQAPAAPDVPDAMPATVQPKRVRASDGNRDSPPTPRPAARAVAGGV